MKPWAQIRQKADAIRIRSGCTFEDAWRIAQAENPDLVRAGKSGAPSSAEIANERASTDRAAAIRKKNSARDRFLAEVRNLQDRGHTYDQAYRICRRDHVELANEMDKPIPAMTSVATMQANMDGSVAALMGIRGDLDDEEIRTVFRAVGKNLTPADYANIWSNLKNYWAGKDTGLSPQDTEIFLRSRFPALAAKLVSLNILQANNTPDSPAASAFARTLKKLNS